MSEFDQSAPAVRRIPVGKRCWRLTEMNEADIHTDRVLDPMAFLPDMDVLGCEMFDRVLDAVEVYDPDAVTPADVRRVLDADVVEPEDVGVLFAPAAESCFEEMAPRAPGGARRLLSAPAAYRRSSVATLSTCLVCGNMSTGATCARRYPCSRSSSRSRACVTTLQLT